ncbi:hypothetical protein Pyn_11903 [Prunus yedoensis var. nudiflora]|uniref:Uncharacterized protein n=1 Tax=Prunus yedoensis var. nudiflora TaxID=2094558 RepID=A0A314ZML7_PRUYE|nr:hypothetical protein Pyn_11903 [Prunus yedoensis var. nudiflora]
MKASVRSKLLVICKIPTFMRCQIKSKAQPTKLRSNNEGDGDIQPLVAVSQSAQPLEGGDAMRGKLLTALQLKDLYYQVLWEIQFYGTIFYQKSDQANFNTAGF